MHRINRPITTVVPLLQGRVPYPLLCAMTPFERKGGYRGREGRETGAPRLANHGANTAQCTRGASKCCWGANPASFGAFGSLQLASGADAATDHGIPLVFLLKSGKAVALHSFQ